MQGCAHEPSCKHADDPTATAGPTTGTARSNRPDAGQQRVARGRSPHRVHRQKADSQVEQPASRPSRQAVDGHQLTFAAGSAQARSRARGPGRMLRRGTSPRMHQGGGGAPGRRLHSRSPPRFAGRCGVDAAARCRPRRPPASVGRRTGAPPPPWRHDVGRLTVHGRTDVRRQPPPADEQALLRSFTLKPPLLSFDAKASDNYIPSATESIHDALEQPAVAHPCEGCRRQ